MSRTFDCLPSFLVHMSSFADDRHHSLYLRHIVRTAMTLFKSLPNLQQRHTLAIFVSVHNVSWMNGNYEPRS